MAKFPDPTKNYTASPVDEPANSAPVDAAPAPTPVETPVYTAPTEPAPVVEAPPEPVAPAPADPPVTPPAAPPPPTLPISSSPFRNLIPVVIGVVVVIILAIVGFSVVPKLFQKSGPVTLTYWGLW